MSKYGAEGHSTFVSMEHVDEEINRHSADLERVLLHSGQGTTLLVQRVKRNADVIRYIVTGTPETLEDLRKSRYNDIRPKTCKP